MKGLILLITSNVFALPAVDPRQSIVVPQQDSYCVADGFAGGSSTVCSEGDAFITESDLLNNGLAFGFAKFRSGNDAVVVTSSPIKAAYFATGTANPFDNFPDLQYKESTISHNADGISLSNRGQDAFNYLDGSSVSSIVDILKKRIDFLASVGANAFRFDELDVCTKVECMTNYVQVIKDICDYIASKNLSVIGNNNSNVIEGYSSSIARVVVDSNVHISGWMVESGQNLDDLESLRATLSDSISIYGICKQGGDCHTNEGQSYGSVTIFKSISYYNY